MALFEGTLEEFEKFIGPATNKVVTRLGKQLKKTQKSCQNHIIGDKTCGVWKSLDAGHFSHLGNDRKSMIQEILKKYLIKNGLIYHVDLMLFLDEFEKAHSPLNKNLIMLCRQHHINYDLKNRIKDKKITIEQNYNDTEISENDIQEPILISQEILLNNLATRVDKKVVKDKIIFLLAHLNISTENCAFAKYTNKKWQFDIAEKKLDQDYNFIFYNSLNYSFDVGKISRYAIQKIIPKLKSKTYKDRNNEKSFNIIFDGTDYVEIGSDQIFEIIYSGKLDLKII
ncbi:hypothetical protein [Halpernia frigidisoli]|uniref:Uncharacterized protein n=1 Tax=Halpernia frigidisoli TaxID=1125876 RepID=A0A1I3CU48_9FLAO|nr:hypothetical protein [Halpernia frigidisoli]SFH77868.1 hypothetical protein SAMN05443292_0073 [Halpernia frigidisoli]